MNFLSAEWKDLLMANYAIDPQYLKDDVPVGTELDDHNGIYYLSLVAFMFEDTRVLGLKVPFHVNFEEVNLRFYVRPINNPEERSVTFLKEIVPLPSIPLIANSLFKENYVSMPMSHRIDDSSVSYEWGKGNCFEVDYSEPPKIPKAGSVEEFISEHYYGFTKNGEKTLSYEVKHPQWEVASATSFSIDVDFEACYGSRFSFLSECNPSSVFYAKGSEVRVSFPNRL